MKATEIRDLSLEELRQKEQDARKEMFNLRLQQTAARLEKPSRVRELRRDIARIQTALNERKRGAK